MSENSPNKRQERLDILINQELLQMDQVAKLEIEAENVAQFWWQSLNDWQVDLNYPDSKLSLSMNWNHHQQMKEKETIRTDEMIQKAKEWERLKQEIVEAKSKLKRIHKQTEIYRQYLRLQQRISMSKKKLELLDSQTKQDEPMPNSGKVPEPNNSITKLDPSKCSKSSSLSSSLTPNETEIILIDDDSDTEEDLSSTIPTDDITKVCTDFAMTSVEEGEEDEEDRFTKKDDQTNFEFPTKKQKSELAEKWKRFVETETPEQRERRLKSIREWVRNSRAKETPQQRERRLREMSERQKLRLANETPEQRERRLERSRVYSAKRKELKMKETKSETPVASRKKKNIFSNKRKAMEMDGQEMTSSSSSSTQVDTGNGETTKSQ